MPMTAAQAVQIYTANLSMLSNKEINSIINDLLCDIIDGRGFLDPSNIQRKKQEAVLCAQIWLRRS